MEKVTKERLSEACDDLLQEALTKGSTDNLSVICVYLKSSELMFATTGDKTPSLRGSSSSLPPDTPMSRDLSFPIESILMSDEAERSSTGVSPIHAKKLFEEDVQRTGIVPGGWMPPSAPHAAV